MWPFKQKKQYTATQSVEDELKKLTEQLVKETIKDIQTSYKERMRHYDKETHPLESSDAENLMIELMHKAMVARQELNARIQHSVAKGTLYKHYYQQIGEVSGLVDEAYKKMKIMERVQERFEYKQKVYANVTGQMYLEKVIAVAQVPAKERHIEDQAAAIAKAAARLDKEKSDV